MGHPYAYQLARLLVRWPAFDYFLAAFVAEFSMGRRSSWLCRPISFVESQYLPLDYFLMEG